MRLLTCGALCALLAACGSKSVDDPKTGDLSADLSGNEGDGDEQGAGEPPSGGDPDAPVSNDDDGTSSSGPGGGTSGNAGGGTSGDPGACAAGFDAGEAPDRVCNSTHRGVCFESEAEACACAGCELADCAIAESYPTQVFCQNTAPEPVCPGALDPDAPVSDTDPCNFVVNGVCFTAGDDACACAGCAPDRCLVLESYPAQVRCQ